MTLSKNLSEKNYTQHPQDATYTRFVQNEGPTVGFVDFSKTPCTYRTTSEVLPTPVQELQAAQATYLSAQVEQPLRQMLVEPSGSTILS